MRAIFPGVATGIAARIPSTQTDPLPNITEVIKDTIDLPGQFKSDLPHAQILEARNAHFDSRIRTVCAVWLDEH
jgi:hypothetical protein